jgi:hypothetical protein
MSFAALYDAVQRRDGRLSIKWLRPEAIQLSRITLVREQWTAALDRTIIRGFYIEGPLGLPVPLKENQALIVLARRLDKIWRRLVFAKELMHVFDSPEELTDTSEKFDAQVERFVDPRAGGSAQFRAESKALFRAVSLYCSELRRLQYLSSLEKGEMSLDVVAAALRMPNVYVRHLFRPDYLELLDACKE